MSKLTWPAWFNSPDGDEAAIFSSAEDVPDGWTSGAEKLIAEIEPEPDPLDHDGDGRKGGSKPRKNAASLDL